MKVRKSLPEGPMVTEVGLLLTRRPPVLAYVDVTLWNTMVVHDLRILERQDGTRVLLMPRSSRCRSEHNFWGVVRGSRARCVVVLSPGRGCPAGIARHRGLFKPSDGYAPYFLRERD